MRNMSFFLTQRQIREQSKTVTRRLGWAWVKPGTLLQPVVKGQGIPKGGKVESGEPMTDSICQRCGEAKFQWTVQQAEFHVSSMQHWKVQLCDRCAEHVRVHLQMALVPPPPRTQP